MLCRTAGVQAETVDDRWRQWRSCHAAIEQLRAALRCFRPDTLIVVGDERHENLVDDRYASTLGIHG